MSSDSDIAALVSDARSKWPAIAWTDELEARFRRCLVARVEQGLLTEAARAEELLLACACGEGSQAALELFERDYLSRVPSFVYHLGIDRDLADEVTQLVRARLFVGDVRRGPRIAEFSGAGSLGGWVRVMAVRVALDLRRASSRATQLLSEDLISGSPSADAAYVKRRYRAALQDAINRAVVELTDEQRALLRRHFVDGMTFDTLAASTGLHKVTVWRKIAAARDTIVTAMRSAIGTHVATSEFESILRTVQSQLDLSLAMSFRK